MRYRDTFSDWWKNSTTDFRMRRRKKNKWKY